VEFCGHVRFSELLNHYATAKVYCLLSHCESFGIPAAKAQVFRNHVVLSDVCAIPEVGGDGGLYGPPNDAEKIAQNLFTLLSVDDAGIEPATSAVVNGKVSPVSADNRR